MDEARVRLFLDTLGHRSLRRAANKANLTEPTLNHKLRALEDELGVSLFDRNPRGIKLTPQGEIFAALAPRFLGTCQDLRSSMSHTPNRDEIWIAATPDLASLILPQFLAHLSQNSRNNASGVIVCHPPELLQGLESGRFNVGLLHSVWNLPNLSSRKLFEDRFTLISGEQLPPISVKAIKEWEIFSPVRDYSAWEPLESFFTSNDAWPRNIVHVNHPLLVTQIVKNHPNVRGIVAEGMLTNLTLKQLQSPFPVKLKDALLPTLPTHVIWRKDESSTCVLEFIALLIKFITVRRPYPSPDSA